MLLPTGTKHGIAIQGYQAECALATVQFRKFAGLANRIDPREASSWGKSGVIIAASDQGCVAI